MFFVIRPTWCFNIPFCKPHEWFVSALVQSGKACSVMLEALQSSWLCTRQRKTTKHSYSWLTGSQLPLRMWARTIECQRIDFHHLVLSSCLVCTIFEGHLVLTVNAGPTEWQIAKICLWKAIFCKTKTDNEVLHLEQGLNTSDTEDLRKFSAHVQFFDSFNHSSLNWLRAQVFQTQQRKVKGRAEDQLWGRNPCGFSTAPKPIWTSSPKSFLQVQVNQSTPSHNFREKSTNSVVWTDYRWVR